MSTTHIHWVLENKGMDAAFNEACSEVLRKDAEVNEMFASPFFVVRVLENGRRKLWPCTEGYISRCYDLQDLDNEPLPEFLYNDDDGKLYPVTVGRQDRINTDEECPFVYAASDIVANGKVVGHVVYTDH